MTQFDGIIRELGWAANRARAMTYLLHALLGSAAWVMLVLLLTRLVPIERPAPLLLAGEGVGGEHG